MSTRVVALKRRQGQVVQGCDVYIGRSCFMGGWSLVGSPYQNPFKVGRDGDIEQVLFKYETYIRAQPQLMGRLDELRGKTLGCWCKKTGTEKCHGDVLLKLLGEH